MSSSLSSINSIAADPLAAAVAPLVVAVARRHAAAGGKLADSIPRISFNFWSSTGATTEGRGLHRKSVIFLATLAALQQRLQSKARERDNWYVQREQRISPLRQLCKHYTICEPGVCGGRWEAGSRAESRE